MSINQINKSTQEKDINKLYSFLNKHGVNVLKNPAIRKSSFSIIEKKYFNCQEFKNNPNSKDPVGVQKDKYDFGNAIFKTAKKILNTYPLSDGTMDKMVNVLIKDLFLERELRLSKSIQYREEYGFDTPGFLVISPSKACNLRCSGCYADSDEKVQTLDWDIVDRIVKDAREIWGTQFIVLSGGEPMAYRSQGKDILDLVEENPESFFMMYTNGTLFDDKKIERISRMGNLIPAFSLEGWRERTDERRGTGVFDKVMNTMDRLYEAGVLYGVSLTATRYNVEEILSDEFIEFLFEEKHVVIGWIFQYMPIGRSFTLDLMPSPQQRLEMWKQSWKLIREKNVFLADFWNHGTLVNGCLSAGGHNNGGYFYIDWNGHVSPCVFVPYSSVNVNEIFANGGDLNSIFSDSYFNDIRHWQAEGTDGNLLRPCLIRDHNKTLRKLIKEHDVRPNDDNAQEAILDDKYAEGMDEYAEAYADISNVVWRDYYNMEK